MDFKPDKTYKFAVYKKTVRNYKGTTRNVFDLSNAVAPRSQSGSYFISKGCKNIQEYTEANPDNLPTNYIFTFFELQDDSTETYFGEGTFLEKKAAGISGFGDGTPTATPVSAITADRHKIDLEMKDMEINRLLADLKDYKENGGANVQSMKNTISDLEFRLKDMTDNYHKAIEDKYEIANDLKDVQRDFQVFKNETIMRTELDEREKKRDEKFQTTLQGIEEKKTETLGKLIDGFSNLLGNDAVGQLIARVGGGLIGKYLPGVMDSSPENVVQMDAGGNVLQPDNYEPVINTAQPPARQTFKPIPQRNGVVNNV